MAGGIRSGVGCRRDNTLLPQGKLTWYIGTYNYNNGDGTVNVGQQFAHSVFREVYL